MMHLGGWQSKKHLTRMVYLSIAFLISAFSVMNVQAESDIKNKMESLIEDIQSEQISEKKWTEEIDPEVLDGLNIKVRTAEYSDKAKINRWAISSDGEIAILLKDIDILEIYDRDGKFMVGFEIDFRLFQNIAVEYAPDNELYLQFARNHYIIKINHNGELLGTWNSLDRSSDLNFESWNVCTVNGYRYYLDEEFQNRIIRTDLYGGGETAIVEKKVKITFFDRIGLKMFLLLFFLAACALFSATMIFANKPINKAYSQMKS